METPFTSTPKRGLPPSSYQSGNDLRAFMGAFPTGVAVVTSRDADGQPYGLTCSSLTSVTLDPPTLLVCLRNNAGGALSVVLSSGSFAVNLLHDGAQPMAELMARTAPDRFDRLNWRAAARRGGAGGGGGGHAAAAGRVCGAVVRGDHTVVFGEVVGTENREGQPLLYGFRRFSGWQSETRPEGRRL